MVDSSGVPTVLARRLRRRARARAQPHVPRPRRAGGLLGGEPAPAGVEPVPAGAAGRARVTAGHLIVQPPSMATCDAGAQSSPVPLTRDTSVRTDSALSGLLRAASSADDVGAGFRRAG